MERAHITTWWHTLLVSASSYRFVWMAFRSLLKCAIGVVCADWRDASLNLIVWHFLYQLFLEHATGPWNEIAHNFEWIPADVTALPVEFIAVSLCILMCINNPATSNLEHFATPCLQFSFLSLQTSGTKQFWKERSPISFSNRFHVNGGLKCDIFVSAKFSGFSLHQSWCMQLLWNCGTRWSKTPSTSIKHIFCKSVWVDLSLDFQHASTRRSVQIYM